MKLGIGAGVTRQQQNSIGATDPYWSSVVLLAMNDNAADAATTFVDQSASAKTITALGNVQYDNAQAPPGMTSCGLFDGAGDYLRLADSSDWVFPDDLTIEFYLRINLLSGEDSLYAQDSQGPDFTPINWSLNRSGVGKTGLFASTTGSSWNVFNDTDTSGGVALSTATWYHLALVRSGNTWYQFRDGVQDWTAAGGASGALADVARTLGIGNGFQSTAGGLNGWLASYRVTKGVARYTANFTPPTLPLLTS